MALEARNRVGGRTYNHDLGNGVISEGGGEWIGPGQTAHDRGGEHVECTRFSVAGSAMSSEQ